MWGPYERTAYERGYWTVDLYIATVNISSQGGYKQVIELWGTAELSISAEGDYIKGLARGGVANVCITVESEYSGKQHVLFIDEPQVRLEGPYATRVYVRSDTDEAMAEVEGIETENLIERAVNVQFGDAEILQAVADELLARWSIEQKSITGEIDLNVTLRFKERIRVIIPQLGIDEWMILQEKRHSLSGSGKRTTVVLGDIVLSADEIQARILEELAG